MRLTGSFVLPPGVELRPALELAEELRQKIGAAVGDFALSRPNSRSYSKIVDAGAAQLIRQFEEPSTIAQAVARFSRIQSNDPEPVAAEQILEDALPLLRSLIREGLLVEAGSNQSSSATESLATGDRVDEYTVVRCVQSLEDTELYIVSGGIAQWGALKIARPDDAAAERMLQNETELLRGKHVTSLPELLAAGLWQERPYLVTKWIFGSNVESAAAEIRAAGDPDLRLQLHTLGTAILEAYSGLHEHGLLHGDIHPRNLIVERQGRVTILDFGLSARADQSHRTQRGGIGFYYEPEFARAELDNRPPPPATFAGEQYALAAMLYLLVTGSHTQDFKLERIEMLNQIATGAMVPFAERGIEAWPALEHALSKALSRDTVARYPSTRELALAWRDALPPDPPLPANPQPDSKLAEIRRQVLHKLTIDGEWMRQGFKTPPTLPINNGAAGLAYALLRISSATDDGETLALADAWITRAVAAIDSAEAFENKSEDPQSSRVGLASLHYRRPGVYVVQALIAAARGDLSTQLRATHEFLAWGREARQEPDPPIDLTLGLAGSLLAAAFLIDAMQEPLHSQSATESRTELLGFGRDLYAQLWTILDGYAPVGEEPELTGFAVAHGWAGLLYASLVWNAATSAQITDSLKQRLDQLATRAQPVARGLHWPSIHHASFPSWCNGSAGQVFLWTEAHRATHDSRYLALAEGAAWNTWESPSRHASLCCGQGGQAYALLNLYRHIGEELWLHRARKMATWAAQLATASSQSEDSPPETRPGSLYNGLAGLAVLDADLDRPLEARMPLFERD
jgi:eukaryotic-like serine/threonine-protein kinase